MILEKSRLDIRTLEPVPAPQTPNKDHPPPYAPPHRHLSSDASGSTPALASSSQINQSRSPSSGSSILNPITPQYVNRFSLYSKQDLISGYFVVDSTLERSDKLIRARAPLSSHNKRFFPKKEIPHAVFGTKKGALKLNLAIARTLVGRRAYVQIHSHSGAVNATLASLPPSNRICLEATTKDGSITVLLPPNFCGGVQFRSERPSSAVHFLPEFASRTRVINGSDKESFVLFGDSDLAASDPESALFDLCLLTTQSGLITVGVSGLDYYEEPKPATGMWQKLVMGLGGGAASDLDKTQV